MDKVLTGLRPYSEGDLDRLLQLVEVSRAWPPAAPANPADMLTRWERWHVTPRQDINVLPGPQGELIAFSRASLITEPSVRVSMELAVHPSWRGKGIGSALYNLIEERTRNLKSSHITTPVFLLPGEARPECVSFMESRGFFEDSSYWQM